MMIMVKVFKTDVQCAGTAENIIKDLLQQYPGFRINFDLVDEDKILRVEGAFFRGEDIMDCLRTYGHYCIDLPIDLNFIN
jgi:phage terminase large subunit-like protein